MFFTTKKRSVTESEEVFNLRGREVPVKLLFSKRKTLSIEVHPDRTIRVRSPFKASMAYIEKNLHERSEWIEQKIRHFELVPEKESNNFNYAQGDKFSFLGEEYSINIYEGLANRVDVSGRTIEISVTGHPSKDKVKRAFDKWFRKTAEEVILERFEICRPIAAKHGIEYNDTPNFRKMKRRWGSCSSKGVIKFNYELARASITEIDYVILHELCHLKEFNHGRNFHKLMTKLMPEWKESKKLLNGYML